MNAIEFKNQLETSLNMQLIITGLVGLIDDEGYTFRETMELLEVIKRNTFPALLEISREGKANE